MPYSWCTTRSPSAISVASAMNWSARFRRRGGRLMRSPSRSCSPTRATRSATKPRSTPSVTSDTDPAGLRRIAAQLSSCAASLKWCSFSRLAMRSREPRVQAASTMRRPSLAQRSAWARNWSNTLIALAALPGTLAPPLDARPPEAKIGPGRPPPSTPAASSGWPKGLNASTGPPASIESQSARSRYRRSGGSGRYGTSPSRVGPRRAA